MLGCKDQNRLLLIPLPMRVFSCIFLFCTIRFLLFLDTTHNNQTIAIDPIVVVSAVFIIFMVCSFLMVCSFPVLVAIGLVEIHGTGRRFLLDAGVSVFVICPPLLVFSNLGEENRGLRVGVWDRSSSSPLSFNSFPFRSRLPLLLFSSWCGSGWSGHPPRRQEGRVNQSVWCYVQDGTLALSGIKNKDKTTTAASSKRLCTRPRQCRRGKSSIQ